MLYVAVLLLPMFSVVVPNGLCEDYMATLTDLLPTIITIAVIGAVLGMLEGMTMKRRGRR